MKTTALSISHLRDYILCDIHDLAERNRIWDKVRVIVDKNTNVRRRVMELEGEETEAWQWVGTVPRSISGALSPR
jgi:hypothetical protein